MRILQQCAFKNQNIPNPNGHYFQNTHNCATLCAGYQSAVQMISSQRSVDGNRMVRRHNFNIEVPPFALDAKVFENVTWTRQQRKREKRIAKMMMGNGGGSITSNNATAMAKSMTTAATNIMKIRNNNNTRKWNGRIGNNEAGSGSNANLVEGVNNMTLDLAAIAENIARNQNARKKRMPKKIMNDKFDNVRGRLKEQFGNGGRGGGGDAATKQLQKRKQPWTTHTSCARESWYA